MSTGQRKSFKQKINSGHCTWVQLLGPEKEITDVTTKTTKKTQRKEKKKEIQSE